MLLRKAVSKNKLFDCDWEVAGYEIFTCLASAAERSLIRKIGVPLQAETLGLTMLQDKKTRARSHATKRKRRKA